MPSPLLGFDADQQTSAVDKDTPQNDRWRTEQIAPRHAPPFTLLAVADGEGPARPGELAGTALDVAFAEARSRRDEPLPELLKHVLEQMNNVVRHRGSGDTVGATLSAVQENTVWVAQAGSQTRCYRVRGRRQALPLTADNDLALGAHPSLQPAPAASHRLRLGDKLVLCSDGLYAAGLVSPADMARIDRYDDIKGAARHLSALAMGRNVRDNVTVLVASYGRSRHLPIRRMLYVLLAVLGAALIILVLGRVLASFGLRLPRPLDWGVGVLAGGRLAEVDLLYGVIPPGTELNALPGDPIHITLNKRESLNSSDTIPIPETDLYFEPGSHLNLAAVDVQGFTDPPAGIEDPTDLTEVALYNGKALILSGNSRTFYVWLGKAQDPKVPLLILQGTDAALAVEHQDGRAGVLCLRGSCTVRLGRRYSIIDAGTRISLETLPSASLGSLNPEKILPQELEAWAGLCSDPAPGLGPIPDACTALLP